MIRHIVVFRWAEGTTAEQIDAVAGALRALPEQISSLRSYEVGPDLRLGEGRWDFAVTATFDDPNGYLEYVDHPAHRAVAEGLIGPIKADRAHVQLEI